MTHDPRFEAVAALLDDTEAAHGIYKSTVLGGVYDQAWSAWYAAHAVDHGIGGLVGHPVASDELATFLSRTFEEFKAAEPKPTEPWSSWTARRIAAEL